jgi:hypothetical protein
MIQLTLQNQRTAIEQALLDTLRLAFLQRQTAADVAALQALDVSAASDGALCYVTAVGKVYTFSYYSGAVQALPQVVAPTTPPPKYAGARWLQSSSQVNWGPNHLAPLAARTSGYCQAVELYRGKDKGQEGLDQALTAIGDVKPSILLRWEAHRPRSASCGYPGSYYEVKHTYSIWCISENDRGEPWSLWGDPVVADTGANGMSAQVEYLLAGLHGSQPGEPRGNLQLQGLMWCEIGDTTNIAEDYQQRRFVNAVELRVGCRFPVPDEDLVAMPPGSIWTEDRLADAGPQKVFDAQNYIAQGYEVTVGTGLTRTFPLGVAVVGGTPTSSTPPVHTFPASSDVYRDLTTDGVVHYLAVFPGSQPPPVTAGALRLGVTTTDASSIVSDRLLCSSSYLFRAAYQVVPPAP